MKKISIIIPVYNTEKYIKECLESIINQMNENIELIIIDDKSIDNSLNIIKETIKNINNIILLENEINKGISFSRNLGLSYATGEYIFFVDSDDYLNKEALNIISENLDSDIVKFSYNKNLGFYNKPRILQLKEKYNINQSKELLYHEDCFVWNKIFRKELIDNLKFKENMKYEDLPFSMISLMKSNTIKNIPDILYNYRMNIGSVTFKDRYIPNDSILDIFSANDILDEQIKQHNLLGYDEILKNLYIYHSFGSVMNAAFWYKMSKNDRVIVVNSLINYIKNKYNIDDIYSSKLINDRSKLNKLYNMRLNYIKQVLQQKHDTKGEIHNIKEIIKKYKR